MGRPVPDVKNKLKTISMGARIAGADQPLPCWDSHLIDLLKPRCNHVIKESF